MIKTIELTKSYDNKKVLKGITEEVKSGEVVVVIGPSGSGKSTFLRCLNLLEEPTSGQIILKIKPSTKKELTSMLSVLN